MIKIALAQYPITSFKDWTEWARHLDTWTAGACRQGARLLVFPEYGAMELCSLMDLALQQDLHGQLQAMQGFHRAFLEQFKKMSATHQCWIVAPSFPLRSGDRIINRAYVTAPSGSVGWQDKWMMTRFEAETWGIHAGPKVLSLFECDWGSFGIQICYDIEFPLGTQLLATAGAGLIVCPSCTETIRGATRVHIGARARALENQCFVAVSQTIGDAPWSPAVDENYGYAAVYSTPDLGMPEQGIFIQGEPQIPAWVYQTLDFSLLEQVRANGQVFNFRDQQQLIGSLTTNTGEIRRFQL